MLKSKSFNQQRKGRQPIELSFILESQGSDTYIHVTSPSNTEEYLILITIYGTCIYFTYI